LPFPLALHERKRKAKQLRAALLDAGVTIKKAKRYNYCGLGLTPLLWAIKAKANKKGRSKSAHRENNKRGLIKMLEK
jgi:hypothetical protein